MPNKNKKRQLKRKYISLEEKIKILNRLKDGERHSSVAKSLNLNEATIRTIKKNESKIRKSVVEGCSLSAKRVARTRDIDLIKMENALMIWLEDCVSKKVPLSGNIIRHKAVAIYRHLKETGLYSAEQQTQSFIASKGWFEKLKKRFSLQNLKFQAEQAPADAAHNFTLEVREITDKRIKASSLDESWKAFLPHMVQKEIVTPPPDVEHNRIAESTLRLKCEGLADMNIQDVGKLFQEQTLSAKVLMELIAKSTPKGSKDKYFENINNESIPNLSLNDLQMGIDLAKKLELHFVEKDPSVVRSGKFRRELQNCLAPYQELLAELQITNMRLITSNSVRLENEDTFDYDFQLLRKRAE